MAPLCTSRGVSWTKVRELLETALSSYANSTLVLLYENMLEQKINFFFTQHFPHQNATPNETKAQLGAFLKTLTGKSNSRKELTGPLMAIETEFIDGYMDRIFHRQRYISFELRKVQRLKISTNEVTDLVKTTMLIRPAVHLFSQRDASSIGEHNSLLVSPAFISKVIEKTSRMLSLMPEAVIKAGINSSLSFQNNPYLESTARLASVFSHRCRNLKSGMRIDRGAESSDKSWFSVARKNYKFYGFDLDMLVELHCIAGENGW